MTPRIRARSAAAILFVLATFVAWLGGGWFHHHSAAAPCEVCKVLHATHAALPSESETPKPSFTAKSLTLHAPEGYAEAVGALPLSRAPPLS